MIEDEMVKNFSEFAQISKLGYILISTSKFKVLTQEKALRYLAWILMSIGGNDYKPRLEKLTQFYNWIITDKNHKARSFYGCIAEKYDKKNLVIYREKAKIETVKLEKKLIWDKRFLIKNKSFKNASVSTITDVELNKLIKAKKIEITKNVFKKILYTIPVIKQNERIISIPHLGFNTDKITVQFKIRTPLKKAIK
jgi:tRNA(Ile)-lysidine synthase